MEEYPISPKDYVIRPEGENALLIHPPRAIANYPSTNHVAHLAPNRYRYNIKGEGGSRDAVCAYGPSELNMSKSTIEPR